MLLLKYLHTLFHSFIPPIRHSLQKNKKDMKLSTTSRPAAFAAIAAVSFLIFMLSMPRMVNMFDEGIVLVNAMRMLSGELVHRDFYSNYGPAQSAIVAGLFKLFGIKIMMARAYGLLVYAVIIATVFDTLRQRVRGMVALSGALLVGLWFFSEFQSLYPIFPCILLAVWGSNLLLSAREKSWSFRYLLLAGLCTGLTTLFRYDVGFFLTIAHLIAILAATVALADKEIKSRLRHAGLTGLAYCAGISIIFLPAAIAFLAIASPQDFMADIVDYPRRYYVAMRGLPFPGLRDIVLSPIDSVVYLPLVAATLAMYAVFRAWAARMFHADTAFLLVYGLVSLAFFFKGVVRVSPLHMLLANVPAMLVLALVVQRWWQHAGWRRTLAVAAGLMLFAPAAQAGWVQASADRNDISRTLAGWVLGQMGQHRFEKPAEFGCTEITNKMAFRVPIDYLRVARYLEVRSLPVERIYVGLNHHDRIFINAVALYFLAERLPAVHWHSFDPGLQNRTDIQLQTVRELTQQATRWLVLDNSFDAIREPNGSSLSSGVTNLDDFIRSHYHQVATSGEVAIWLINGAAAPATNVACMAAPI